MPGLQFYSSNRLEILAHQAARTLQRPLGAIMTPEVIVVQSRGMERWLSLALAHQLGVWANCDYPFPNAFLTSLCEKVLADLPDAALFEPACLTLRIMRLFPTLLPLKRFDSLQRYLADDPDGLKQFQLAAKIADLYDQYAVFRPEMILQWEAGQSRHWQAELWRRLVADADHGWHRARQHQKLLSALASGEVNSRQLPERVTVFGISHLPPFHLQVLVALARYVRIYFYILNPCRQFWGDIVSDRDIARIKNKVDPERLSADSLYLEPGNRLLASMGKLGRDFLQMLTSIEAEAFDRFAAPDRSSLLNAVQYDILELRDSRNGALPVDGVEPAPHADGSIQVHACHSAMREIEILHDQLLGMLADDPELKPQDIIVMAPDIEAYAPYVRAVFESQTDDSLRIPFTITDQSVKRTSRIVEAFIEILALQGSRMGVNQVLALLEYPAVRQRFELNRDDIELIEHWLSETAVRWGVDAANRARMDLPDLSPNTWQTGIERMLLGYAMAGGNENLFQHILPFDDIEGQDARTLGQFIEFTDTVFSTIQAIGQPYRFCQWAEQFNGMLEAFFNAGPDTEPEMQLLREAFHAMANHTAVAGFDQPVGLAVVQAFLAQQLGRKNFGANFMAGGVTFCAMLPMRSIPKAVICLIGMNNAVFPRQTQTLAFNFMTQTPRIGDRSKRDDDTYLFLEAIVSSRKKLYISYVGQSIQDNSKIPPSVMVSELCDYLCKSYDIAEADLITEHRLQPFAPEYFRVPTSDEHPRWFSFSQTDCQAAGLLDADREVVPAFRSTLPEGSPVGDPIALDQLIAFFDHPARYLLQERLGVRFPADTEGLDEREPFHVDALTAYRMKQEMLQKQIAGQDLNRLEAAYLQRGVLPHGPQAQLEFDRLCASTQAFAEKINRFRRVGRRSSVDVDLHLSRYHLTGRLNDVYASGIIGARYGRTRGKDLVGLWIRHLALAASGWGPAEGSARLVCQDKIWQISAIPKPEELLVDLLGFFRKGLRIPAHFFPETSYQFAHQVYQQGRTETHALKAARNVWLGNAYSVSRAESQDPYNHLCFRYADPLDEEFCQSAALIFKPLFAHLTELL